MNKISRLLNTEKGFYALSNLCFFITMWLACGVAVLFYPVVGIIGMLVMGVVVFYQIKYIRSLLKRI